MNEVTNHLPPKAASQEKPMLAPTSAGITSPGEEVARVANGSEASKSLLTKGSKEADDRRAGNGCWWVGVQSPLPRPG